MSDEKVRELMGEPDDTTPYTTGRVRIPYYHGPDPSRADWLQTGVGRVVFTRNRYSQQLEGMKALYSPNR